MSQLLRCANARYQALPHHTLLFDCVKACFPCGILAEMRYICPMRKWMILGALVGGCLGLQAQTLQQKVDLAVSAEPLKGAVVGVMVQDAAGRTLASREAGRRMVPASNMKLVTTGTALHALGPDFQFETGIGYVGEIDPDGTLHGDVYVVGGGDPTIGVADTVSVKPDAGTGVPTRAIWRIRPGGMTTPARITAPAAMRFASMRMRSIIMFRPVPRANR